MRPLVSLVCICGDGGVSTLGRMVKSVLNRPTGPMVEEVLIAWNGKNDAALVAQLVEAGATAAKVEDLPTTVGETEPFDIGDTCVNVLRQKWTNDFSAARNEAHAAASGTWHFVMDSDDLCLPPDDPQVAEELRKAGVPESVISAPVAAGSGSLRDYLQGLERQGRNSVAVPYHYVVESDGRPLQRQWKIRILRWADGWTWVNRIHEDLKETYGNVPATAMNAGLLIRHLPGEAVRSRLARNAEINQLVVEEIQARGAELTFREWFNLGAIAYDDREWDRAIEYLTKAAALSERDGVLEEALVAMDYLARAQIIVGKTLAAVRTGHEMLRIYPNRPEGYVVLVGAHYARQEWGAVARWYDMLESIKTPNVVAVENVVERNAWPMAWAAEGFSNLGYHDRAKAIAEKAVTLAPNDVLVRRTLDSVLWAKEQVDALCAVESLVRFHMRNGDAIRAKQVLTASPAWEDDRFRALRTELDFLLEGYVEGVVDSAWTDDADLAAWLNRVKSRLDRPVSEYTTACVPTGVVRGQTRRHGLTSTEVLSQFGDILEMDKIGENKIGVVSQKWYDPMPPRNLRPRHITIYAPIHNEIWTPEQARTHGIGGSEEAIVYLAEELTRLGHTVTVYGPSNSELRVRIVGGVEYRRFQDYRPSDKTDILIAHRAPWLSHESPDCDQFFVWHHDYAYPHESWNLVSARVGSSLFVSKWQADALSKAVPTVPVRGAVIGNGVPEDQCGAPDESKRVPFKVVYASQPIRGLSRLLEIWPQVLAAQPTAELHIFYGKHTNQVAADAGIKKIANELDKVEALLAVTPRVIDHGRVGQTELMNEMRTSSVWAYSCLYPEVSCISGIRAAAAGCIPVFTTFGSALAETQPDQTYAVAEYWEKGGKEKFVANLLAALVDTKFDRAALRAKALKLNSWSAVAARLLTAITEAEVQPEEDEAAEG